MKFNDKRHKETLVKADTSLREALKQMDKAALQVLIVVDSKNRILGVVTDGDTRRVIIEGNDLDRPIGTVMKRNPVTVYFPPDEDQCLNLMRKHDIKHIPVIDRERRIIGIVLWKDFLYDGRIVYPPKENTVVIMAGGEGKRLDPFTKIFPKPLIPIGEKPIIHIIMDNFKKYGFNKYIISLNYKAEMIKMYFLDTLEDYQIEYVQEDNPMGTAGALSLIKDKLNDTFIVSNCDVIVDANFDTVLNYHKENKNHATILGIIRNIRIPYGVLRMQNADLDEISEKPEYHFVINSGIYILEPDIIDAVSKDKSTDMPNLLSLAKKNEFKIQVYPVSCSWFDVGEWEEYKRAVEYIRTHNE